jgi:hypothetical protein
MFTSTRTILSKSGKLLKSTKIITGFTQKRSVSLLMNSQGLDEEQKMI